MRTFLIRLFTFASIAVPSAACQERPTPPAPSPTTPTEAVRLAPAPQPEATADLGADHPLTTRKPADLARMPTDALHASFAGGGAHGAAPSNAAGALPPGHPPLPSAQAPPAAPPVEAQGDLPLPLEGAGSAAELRRRAPRLQALPEAARRDLERAFRLAFTARRELRDYAEAARLATPLLEDAQAGPMAARVLGAVALNTGFDAPAATAHYRRAVERDPEYGEAHYALAFMLSMTPAEADAARRHFAEAARLGVEDTAGLEGRLAAPAHP